MLCRIEFDRATGIEAALCEHCHGHQAQWRRLRLDRVGDIQHLIGCCELDAVAYGKLPTDFTVDADAGKATRIVGGKLPVGFFDGEKVVG